MQKLFFLVLIFTYSISENLQAQTYTSGLTSTGSGATTDVRLGGANPLLVNTTIDLGTFSFGVKKSATNYFTILNNGNIGIGNANPIYLIDVSGTSRLNGLQIFQGSAASDSAALNAELLSTANWTSAGWTGNFTTGWIHTTGNVTPLSNLLAATAGQFYQITYTITGRTAGTIDIGFGGITTTAISATSASGILAATTGNLSITPTTDFNGTVIISTRLIGTSSATTTFASSDGIARMEIRASKLVGNTFIGLNAGQKNTTGTYNSFLGYQAGYSNTTGSYNYLLGSQAGLNNTVGNYNNFISYQAGYNNTQGNANNFIGYAAGFSNTTGSYNNFIGSNSGFTNSTGSGNVFISRYAGYGNTTGSWNSAVGYAAGYNNTTGGYNSMLGYQSGRYIADGTTAATNINNSVFIGTSVRPLGDNQTNQLAIGYSAVGLGSNSSVIGNSSTAFGRWWGRLLLGTSIDDGSSVLQIQGTAASDGALYGSEQSSTGTGAGWTGTSFVSGYTHTPTATTALVGAFTPTAGQYYKVTVTTTGTVGSVSYTFGGYTSGTINFASSNDISPTATTAAVLTVTPSSTFDGVVTVSIKSVLPGIPVQSWKNSSGVVAFEMRASGIVSNTYIGLSAGSRNTTGNSNTALGNNVLGRNSSGVLNTASGFSAMANNDIGNLNTAYGGYALTNNTTGDRNTAIGDEVLYSNTTGYNNTAGGTKSLNSNTTGFNNTAYGQNSGRFISGGVVVTANSSNSTFLGMQAYPLADNQTNQTVIGYNAVGDGSNTTVLGSSSTVSTKLFGQLKLPAYGTGAKTGTATYTLATDATGNIIEVAAMGVGSQWSITGNASTVPGTNFIGTTDAQRLVFKTSNVEQATILSNGNIGIGNNNPLYKLDVNGTGQFSSDLFVNGKTFGRGSGNMPSNIAVGQAVLAINTTGNFNTGLGDYSLYANTTGQRNTATGTNSLVSNGTGNYNVAHGYSSFADLVTGNFGTAIGYQASNFTAGFVGIVTNSNNSTFLGARTQALADNQTNEIVVGFEAVGNGSNTVTLGNDAISKTILKGGLNFKNYGHGVNAGTPAYGAYFDATGNVIEGAVGTIIFQRTAVPFANASTGLLGSDSTTLSYNPTNRSLNIGTPGFSQTSGLNINGGNFLIYGGGNGATIATGGGYPTDLSKSISFQNNDSAWAVMYQASTYGELRTKFNGSILPTRSGIYSLGLSTNKWSDLWVTNINGVAYTGGGGTGWGLSGNMGTNNTSQFIGTTDNMGLIFRTNNITRLSISASGNVGIGTTNISDTAFKLFVETGIHTRKVKVDVSAWPDYVFDKDYELPTLSELGKFIQQNKHLPGVQSASDAEKNGIDLGNNQTILLKKVEELTLYLIQMKEENEQMKERIRKLESKNAAK